MSDRREHPRHPVDLPLVQLIDDRRVDGVVSDISLTGLHVCRLVGPFARSSRQIRLEVTLPGLPEPLCADGEVVYDAIGPVLHETGVRFVALGSAEARRLGDWLGLDAPTA